MSLDIEQRFICSLLHAPITEQESFFEKQLPVSIFKQREAEANWIYRFREKHGRYPSPALLRSRFKWKVRIVKDKWSEALDTVIEQEHYRQIKNVVTRTREMMDEGSEMQKVVSYFQDGAQTLTSFEVDSEDIDFAKSRGAMTRYTKIKDLLKHPQGSLFTTPWPSINRVIKFMRPEELAVVQGRLGMGKSYILLWWADFLAKQGHRVLFVSKEMSTAALEDRLELIRYKINPDRFRDGNLTSKEIRNWERARMKKHPEHFVLTGSEKITGTGFSEIYAAIKKYKPQVVFVDAAYKIMLEGEAKLRLTDVEKFTRIAQTAFRAAKATKTFWCISIQMNRGAEDKKGNTKGGVVNAYGADAWLQEANLGIALNGKRDQPLRELDIIKSRESGSGTIVTNFKFSPFIDISEVNKTQLNSTLPSKQFTGI